MSSYTSSFELRSPSLRHTVVISDIHLCEAEPSEGKWLWYRQKKYFPDFDFSRFVTWFLSNIPTDHEFELILGGDIFEFEGPRIVNGASRFENQPGTEQDSIEVLQRIVRDHSLFFRSLAQIILEGHNVAFVAGNHDAQLAFSGVQNELYKLLQTHVEALQHELGLEKKIQDQNQMKVYSWFYQTRDRVHIEHGHQYDSYCSFRDPLRPLDVHGLQIQPTAGSLAFRHIISRLGYFNAHDERTFMLSLPEYIAHWVRYYLFTRRSLLLTYWLGTLRVLRELIQHRPAEKVLAVLREQAEIARIAYAQMLALDSEALTHHAKLFETPIDENPRRMAHELHFDNFALGLIGIGGIITAAFKPKLGLAIAVGALTAGVLHSVVRPRIGLESRSPKPNTIARQVAKIYNARAVVFGHTHVPFAEAEEGIVYANAGSWAPTQEELENPEQSPGRPLIWLQRSKHDENVPIEGGLYYFRKGEVVEQCVVDHSATIQEPTIENTTSEEEKEHAVGWLQPLTTKLA